VPPNASASGAAPRFLCKPNLDLEKASKQETIGRGPSRHDKAERGRPSTVPLNWAYDESNNFICQETSPARR